MIAVSKKEYHYGSTKSLVKLCKLIKLHLDLAYPDTRKVHIYPCLF